MLFPMATGDVSSPHPRISQENTHNGGERIRQDASQNPTLIPPPDPKCSAGQADGYGFIETRLSANTPTRSIWTTP